MCPQHAQSSTGCSEHLNLCLLLLVHYQTPNIYQGGGFEPREPRLWIC